LDVQTQTWQRPGIPWRELRVIVRESGHERALVVRDEPITVGTAESNRVVLRDPTVSRFHLRISREGECIHVRDLGSRNGTRLAGVTLRGAAVEASPGCVLTIGNTSLELVDGSLVMVDAGLEVLEDLRSCEPAMKRIMARAVQAAKSDLPVVLLGESGTGKELLARAIHNRSKRAGGPFVVLDCSSIPAALFSSELLGHEKGAFTSALSQRKGAFEQAHGGTLFLDEIGELEPGMQSALLGVLERGRFKRVGGTEEQEADVRIVCATHRDLRKAVNTGAFRLDLFYRIAVVLLEVPSLRERPEDVPLLMQYFLEKSGSPTTRVRDLFSEERMRELRRHDWPGNVRELRNLVLRAVAMGDDAPIAPAPVHSLVRIEDAIDGELLYGPSRKRLLDAFEKKFLATLMQHASGNIRRAASVARIDRSYLMDLLRRHGFR
jgi:DNA-binding NtrC family response regulator